MKIIKKRAFAYVIDCLLIGIILVASNKIFISFGVDISKFNIVIVIFLSSFKDCVFINASVGKKLLGVAVYNKKWNKPTLLHSLKRTLSTFIVAPISLCRISAFHMDKMIFLNWEKNVLQSFVIDKNVYKKLTVDAQGVDGNFSDNMTELYMMYLRDIYSK